MSKRINPIFNPGEDPNEIWVDIKGFEGKYQISNHGRVLSLRYHRGNKPRVLIPRIPKRKVRDVRKDYYPYVVLSDNGKTKTIKIHRCVATYFIPNPDNKTYVNHKDGDVTNNHVSNLEWVTPQENTIHAIHVLNHTGNKGFKYDKATNSKPVAQIFIDPTTKYEYVIAIYANASVAEQITGINGRGIALCCNGKYHLAGGYKWQYQSSFKIRKRNQ